MASGSNVYIKGTTEVTNCTGSGLYLAQSTTTQLHFSGKPQVKNNDINVNMTQITTTQDSQFTNIVSAENLESGSDIGLNITNSKYDGAGELFGKADQPSANVNLIGFKNDVNTPLVGWPVTYGQAGNSYWVTTISINAKLLTFGVESDIEGSEGIFAPDRYQGSNIDTAQVSGLATAYAKMNSAVADANRKCSYPATYTYAYAKIGDTEITNLHYTENTGVWTYDIKNGASSVTFDRTTPVTLYYYVNPAPVKVKWVEMDESGNLSALDSTNYPDGSFNVSTDQWYDNSTMHRAYSNNSRNDAPVVIGKCFYQYVGLGKSTASNTSALTYSGISDFNLKNSAGGLIYNTSNTGDGTTVAGMDTIYVIYSKTPPTGSTYLDIANNSDHPFTLWNIFVGEDSSHMHKDKAVLIKGEDEDLVLLNESGTQVASNSTMSLVLLDAANDQFYVNGGFQGVAHDTVVAANISNPDTNVILSNGKGLYNTDAYIKGTLLDFGKKVTVTFGDAKPICKITDSSNQLLYKADGTPAIYTTLKEAFSDISNGRLYTTAAHDVRYTSKDLSVKMLVENYDYNEDDAARLTGGYNVTLTTAEMQSANTDGYYFPGTGNAGITRTGASSNKSILSVDGASLTLTKIGFNGNNVSVDADSSIISIPSGTLNVNAETVIQKAKARKGAAIHAGSSTTTGVTIHIDGAQFTNNEAIRPASGAEDSDGCGGAIYAGKNTTISVKGTIFNGNVANKGGGAIAMYGTSSGSAKATLTIEGSTFIGNEAKGDVGGAIRVSEWTDVTLNADTFTNNKASSASSGNAGAVAVLSNQSKPSSLTINNGGFTGNEAAKDGGAIRVGGYATVTINGAELSGNKAVNGGAIALAANASLKMNGGASLGSQANGGNTATGNGGGVYGEGAVTVNMTGSASIISGTAVNGGGIYAAEGSSITMDGPDQNSMRIYSCSATQAGGGIYLASNDANKSTMTMNKAAAINSCIAGTNGGGVYLGAGATMTMDGNGATGTKSGSTEVQYTYIGNSTAGGDGGGLYAETGATITLNNKAEISNNTGNNGGGAYLNGATLTMNESQMKGNTAKVNGGGIYQNGGTVNMKANATIDNCKAITDDYGCGGGVCMNGGTANIEGTVKNCAASGEGGGISARNNATLKVYDNARIKSCNAAHGGGIHINGTQNASVYGNTTIEDCITTGYGGGIYVNTGKLDLYGNAEIKNCKAGYNTDGTDSSNPYSPSGGGIDIAWGSASATIRDNVKITNCQARSYGGGMNIENQGDSANATISDSVKVTGCSAPNGGGVNVANGSTLTMTGGEISGNSATTAGGGINVTGTGAKLYFSGDTKVTGNTVGSDTHNVCLPYDNNEIINSSGLESSANIGVYITGDMTGDLFTKHGEEGDPFGTYSGTDPQNLNKFVNDRNNLTAMKGTSNNQIIWSTIPAPTGVNLRFLPWILIAFAGGALLLMFRRRRNA